MSRREQNPQRTGWGARDWIVLGSGAVILVALVAFVVTRMNRARPVSAATPESTAPTVTQPPPGEPPQEPAEAAVRRISPQQLRAEMAKGDVTVIDVRDEESYAAGHVAGALHIPLSLIDSQVPYLPPGKPIVAYCT